MCTRSPPFLVSHFPPPPATTKPGKRREGEDTVWLSCYKNERKKAHTKRETHKALTWTERFLIFLNWVNIIWEEKTIFVQRETEGSLRRSGSKERNWMTNVLLTHEKISTLLLGKVSRNLHLANEKREFDHCRLFFDSTITKNIFLREHALKKIIYMVVKMPLIREK